MTKSAQQLLDKALALSSDERAVLALRLSESLDGPADEGAVAAWAAVVSRRVEEVRAGTASVVSAQEAVAKARDQIKRP